jgi:hypothetical protein
MREIEWKHFARTTARPAQCTDAWRPPQDELIGFPILSAADPTAEAAANGIGFAITFNHAQGLPSGSISRALGARVFIGVTWLCARRETRRCLVMRR